MLSNKVNTENSNMSGSEDAYTDTNVVLNPMVLLVRVEHVDDRPIELEILTEAAFKELCTYTNPSHTPHAVEILSPLEICLTYKQGIILGHVAGELMVIESWIDFPILVTVVIFKRSKVDATAEARQKHQQIQKEKEQIELDKLKQGQYDLLDELDQVVTHKEKLAQQLNDNDEKQMNL